MEQNKQYDFVIVGSGVAGLTCGILLAKEGHSVLILEKNQQIGGALQVFSRDKCIFDTGVHYLGGLDMGENLHRIFSYLGILNHVEFSKMEQKGFDQIHFPDGFIGKLGMGYDNFRTLLVKDFPHEEAAIDVFIQKLHETIDFFPLYNLQNSVGYVENMQEVIHSKLAYDELASIFSDQRLIHVILGNAMIYAGDMKRTPFYVLALILNSYIKGSYRLPGGGGLLIKAFVKEFRRYGGEVLKHKEVCQLNVVDNKVVGVICKDGTAYQGKNVISNVHPSMTINLTGETHFKPAYRKRIQNLKNTVSSFSVFLTLKSESVKYINHNRYELYTENPFDTVDYDSANWPNYLMVSTGSTKVNRAFANTISILTYMDKSEVEEWSGTFNTVPQPSDREESYQSWKRKKENQVLEKFFQRYPDVKDEVIGVYSSSPLTYKDYLGTPEGELYGVEKDIQQIHSATLNTRTKVDNLYLTGQNIVLHGILGSCIGALLTTFNFIDRKELLDKINHGF